MTPDENGLFAAYDKPVDFANKENISGLTEYTKSLKKKFLEYFYS